MKRIGTLMLTAVLVLSLAACSSSSSMGSSLSSAGNALDGNASSETFGEMIDEVLPDVDYSLLRTGLGIVSSTAESAAAEGAIPGNAKFSATICALAVKPDGSIADVKFDTVEAGLAFDSSGTLTGDASQEIHTKKELGDDYGLKAASGIGKEWYEQIDALEEWMRGKMVSDVLGMKVTEREGGRQTAHRRRGPQNLGDHLGDRSAPRVGEGLCRRAEIGCAMRRPAGSDGADS